MNIDAIKKFVPTHEFLNDTYILSGDAYTRYRIEIKRNNVYMNTNTHVYFITKDKLTTHSFTIRVLCINKRTDKPDSVNDEPCFLEYNDYYDSYRMAWAKNGIFHRSGNFPAIIEAEVVSRTFSKLDHSLIDKTFKEKKSYYRNGNIWCYDGKNECTYYISKGPTAGLIRHNLFGPAFRGEYYIYGKKYTKEEYNRVVRSIRKIYLRNRFHAWVRSFLRKHVWDPKSEYFQIWVDQKYDDLDEFQSNI